MTDETAARQRAESLLRVARQEHWSDEDSVVVVARDVLALLSELATARQERDDWRGAAQNNYEAWQIADGELGVVRRQLQEAREALRRVVDEADPITSDIARKALRDNPEETQ